MAADTVVLLHGIWMRAAVTRTLGERLSAAGFDVKRIDYASVLAPFSDHFDAIDAHVRAAKSERVHLVGHSLGGVLALHYLSQREGHLPPGRVVCLGSPLRGSQLAQRLERAGLAAWSLGHAREALTQPLPDWNGAREVGVIAGTLAIGMGLLLGPLGEPSDGTVALTETRLPGIHEHLALRVSHTGLLYSKRTAEATVRFLREGRFR
jgi:pimeloyl-ACP methyl ester carboxylesterase